MPELPEVEVLVRALAPLLRQRTIHDVSVNRARIVAPATIGEFKKALRGATFETVSRRGKYLLFPFRPAKNRRPRMLIGHLGMTGRIYLVPARAILPKHAAVVFNLGRERAVFEDTRYFGRLTLDAGVLARLGPEPLSRAFTPAVLARALARSRQAIKVKLLDQSIVAGIGNIYASEALFRARISPRLAARRLTQEQIVRLWRAIRRTLTEAIRCGSTVALNFSGAGRRDGYFYFGRSPEAATSYEERLRVYDRAGQPCVRCGTGVRRMVQAARSTFYCPKCQA